MRCRLVGLLLSGVVVASSGCSMDATVPSSLAAPQSAAMARSGQGEQHAQGTDGGDKHLSGSATYRVTIDPTRPNLLRFGPHTLEIPAGAVCDRPSGYGPGAFDEPCDAETKPVAITAVVRTTAVGVPRIDLLPEMRFSPTHTVTLTLYVPSLTPESSQPNILYCATPSLLCVDESQRDPTLVTHANYEARTLFRRIKHFSGYFVES
jgi:hypothetical protein